MEKTGATVNINFFVMSMMYHPFSLDVLSFKCPRTDIYHLGTINCPIVDVIYTRKQKGHLGLLMKCPGLEKSPFKANFYCCFLKSCLLMLV